MIRHVTLCALLLALAACDSESPTGPEATGIYRHSGNEQRGAVGTLLPGELTVFVAGPDGAPEPNRAVTFEIVEGAGRVTAPGSTPPSTSPRARSCPTRSTWPPSPACRTAPSTSTACAARRWTWAW